MVKAGKISQYRERLDKTLASPELKSHDAIKGLVKNQLQHSSLTGTEEFSEEFVEKRTTEVSNFLDMLRSASVEGNEASHSEWKLKDDNEDYRVMYRPGPQGTPLHTLLVEGYVDGRVDTCLCISWESTLYKKWWPQFNFPPFKVVKSERLKTVRNGEQICLVRVKIAWPLSSREVVVHFLSFQHFKDDLIIVLLNSISDVNTIDVTTHGFTRDGIPEAEDVVRIDVVGGFALQKVTSERSYFRTIANLDVKLDFVPPSLINFISRQLIGSAFKLYKKVVASASKYDEDYSKALEDPMYAAVREALYSVDASSETTKEKELQQDSRLLTSDQAWPENSEKSGETQLERSSKGEILSKNAHVKDSKGYHEIEEEKNEVERQDYPNTDSEAHSSNQHIQSMKNNEVVMNRTSVREIEEEDTEDSNDVTVQQTFTPENNPENHKSNTVISPEVQQALDTLEKAISLVRKYRPNVPLSFSSMKSYDGDLQKLGKPVDETTTGTEHSVVCSDDDGSAKVSKLAQNGKIDSSVTRNSSRNENIRRAGSNSYASESNPNRVVPTSSPEQSLSIPVENIQGTLSASKKEKEDDPITEIFTAQEGKRQVIHDNGTLAGSFKEGDKLNRPNQRRNCCFF